MTSLERTIPSPSATVYGTSRFRSQIQGSVSAAGEISQAVLAYQRQDPERAERAREEALRTIEQFKERVEHRESPVAESARAHRHDSRQNFHNPLRG